MLNSVRMEYEVFLWEAKGKRGGPCPRPSLNEVRLLKLCCWAMGGTLAQRRLASMLLHDLEGAALIERKDVLEHGHAIDFWTAFGPSFKDGPISADAYLKRLLCTQKEFQPDLLAKAERLYGSYMYCGDVVGEYPGHAVAYGYLVEFAQKLSLLSHSDDLKDADVVKQFETLTALGSVHWDFQARGDPQRRAAASQALFRPWPAWLPRARTDLHESDNSGKPEATSSACGPSKPSSTRANSASGRAASSNRCSSAHGGAPTCAGQAAARRVGDATDSEGESSMAGAEDIPWLMAAQRCLHDSRCYQNTASACLTGATEPRRRQRWISSERGAFQRTGGRRRTGRLGARVDGRFGEGRLGPAEPSCARSPPRSSDGRRSDGATCAFPAHSQQPGCS